MNNTFERRHWEWTSTGLLFPVINGFWEESPRWESRASPEPRLLPHSARWCVLDVAPEVHTPRREAISRAWSPWGLASPVLASWQRRAHTGALGGVEARSEEYGRRRASAASQRSARPVGTERRRVLQQSVEVRTGVEMKAKFAKCIMGQQTRQNTFKKHYIRTEGLLYYIGSCFIIF